MKRRLLPPSYLNVLLVVEIGMHFIFPIKEVIQTPYRYLGLFLIFFGVVLNVYAVRHLKRENTTINFHKTATRLVVTGPFRISRNPIYLSGVILSLGMAILLGSVITFIFPIVLTMILNGLYIPAEERRLEGIFGAEYLDYKQNVRRWL